MYVAITYSVAFQIDTGMVNVATEREKFQTLV